jgi:hypothetical protein
LYNKVSLRGTTFLALITATYLPLRLGYLTVSFLRHKPVIRGMDDDVDGEPHARSRAHAHIAMIYNMNLALLLFSPLGLWFILVSEDDLPDVINTLYESKLIVYAPVAALTAAYIIDACISSIDFRITYILPTVVYVAIFMIIGVLRFGSAHRLLYIGVSIASSIGISLSTFLFGRMTNACLPHPDVPRRNRPVSSVVEARLGDQDFISDFETRRTDSQDELPIPAYF